MSSPQFKAGNTGVFNRKVSMSCLRKVDSISIIGLYLSEALLFLGILLILLNNLNVVAPGSYFGAYNWVTVAVFSIGLFINFISIPFLYFSSLKNFINESSFWDKETFWILPLFFFGTFFLYNSMIALAVALLVVSILVIAFIHVIFTIKAHRLSGGETEEFFSNKQDYAITMKYLSAYYIILLALLFAFDPMQQVFVWIRIHT
jgi:hypothetical protein